MFIVKLNNDKPIKLYPILNLDSGFETNSENRNR